MLLVILAMIQMKAARQKPQSDSGIHKSFSWNSSDILMILLKNKDVRNFFPVTSFDEVQTEILGLFLCYVLALVQVHSR